MRIRGTSFAKFVILFGLIRVSCQLSEFTSKIDIRQRFSVQILTHADCGGELIEDRVIGNRTCKQEKFDLILQGDVGSGFINQNLFGEIRKLSREPFWSVISKA